MDTLLTAIVDDDLVRVSKLLSDGADLARRPVEKDKLYNARIFHWLYVGDTPLHLAAAGYRIDIAKALIDAGADPNAAGNRRRSRPLHYASDGYIMGPEWSAEKQVKTLKLLLSAGADLHAQDQNGATALHRAVRTRCAAAALYLLSIGSDPTVRNKPGSTAFHLAVQNTGRGGSGEEAAKAAQKKIIEGFLSFGVSPNLRDGKCQSVRDCARSDWIRDLLIGQSPNFED